MIARERWESARCREQRSANDLSRTSDFLRLAYDRARNFLRPNLLLSIVTPRGTLSLSVKKRTGQRFRLS